MRHAEKEAERTWQYLTAHETQAPIQHHGILRGWPFAV